MKITFIISSLGSGGAERVLSILVNKLVNNHNVTIITLANNKSFYPLDNKIKHIKLDLLKESKNILQSLLNSFNRIKILTKTIKQENPDIVISFMTHTNILAIIASKIARGKIIISERTAYDFYNSKILNLIRRIIYPFSDMLITQTKADKKNYTFLKNIKVIYNPLETKECDTNKKDKIILGVGRLDNQKGFELLIEVFSQIKKDDWKLIIVGDGQERNNLENLIKKLQAQNIELIGKTKEIFKWYEKASIFVLSSKKEGFPNVLIEAMSCGCASIAFDCPYGPGEIIEDGVNGILVENQNQQRLKEAIERLINDKDLREKFSYEAIKVREKYSVEKIVKEWEKVIGEVLNG